MNGEDPRRVLIQPVVADPGELAPDVGSLQRPVLSPRQSWWISLVDPTSGAPALIQPLNIAVPDDARALIVGACTLLYDANGNTFEPALRATRDTIAALNATGAALATRPGDWSVFHRPAANTQATITRAAAAGQRHIITSITATIAALAAAVEGVAVIQLLSGATVLWEHQALITPGSQNGIAVSNLSIVCGENEAAVLRFSAAGGASTFESVSMTGHDAS